MKFKFLSDLTALEESFGLEWEFIHPNTYEYKKKYIYSITTLLFYCTQMSNSITSET